MSVINSNSDISVSKVFLRRLIILMCLFFSQILLVTFYVLYRMFEKGWFRWNNISYSVIDDRKEVSKKRMILIVLILLIIPFGIWVFYSYIHKHRVGESNDNSIYF